MLCALETRRRNKKSSRTLAGALAGFCSCHFWPVDQGAGALGEGLNGATLEPAADTHTLHDTKNTARRGSSTKQVSQKPLLSCIRSYKRSPPSSTSASVKRQHLQFPSGKRIPETTDLSRRENLSSTAKEQDAEDRKLYNDHAVARGYYEEECARHVP
jgi:hypothetical protein